MDGKLKGFWPLAWIALFWFVAFSQFLFWHRWIHWDMIVFFLPHFIYANDIFRAGHLPLWNPFLDSGVPFFSNPQSHLWYPPNQLVIWTVGYSIRSLQYELFLHYLAAGITSYALARKYMLSRSASTLAAVSYMLSGIFVGNAEHFNVIVSFTWMPLALAGVEGWFSTQRKNNLWFLGASILLMLTGGHFGPDLICFLFLGIFIIIRALESIRRDGFFVVLTTKLAQLALACGVAALLSGIYLVPVLSDLATFSDRGSALPDQIAVDLDALPAWGILTVILPAYSFNSALIQKWESISMLNCYLGLVCLCLAVFAIYARPSRNVLILSILSVLAFLVALGGRGGLRELLYNFLPFFKVFRNPALFRGIFILFFSLLGGFGLDRLRNASPGEQKSFRRAILLFLTVLAIFTGLVGALFALYSKINNDAAMMLRENYLETLPLQVLILLALYFWLTRREKISTLGILLLSSIDLTLMAQTNIGLVGDYIKRSDQKAFDQTFFVSIPGRKRTVVNYHWQGRIDNWNQLDNSGEIFKQFQVSSYGPSSPEYYSIMDTGFYKVAAQFPRFFIAPWVSVSENFELSLAQFAKAAAAGTFPVMVSTSPPEGIEIVNDAEYAAGQVSSNHIEVKSFSINRLELVFETDRPALFVSTETYHNGWEAWLDGKRVPTIKVDFVFRGVYVSAPGRHSLVWEFHPKSFDYGLAVSSLGLVALVAWIGIARRRNPRARVS